MGAEVRKRRRMAASWLLVLFLILLVLFPSMAYFPPGIPWGVHTSCQIGTLVADENVSTPIGVADAPYHGNASFMTSSLAYVFTSGDLREVYYDSGSSSNNQGGVQTWGEGTGGSNGSIVTGLVEDEWQVYTTVNRTSWSSGPSAPCTSHFMATPVEFGNGFTSGDLIGPGNMTDTNISSPTENFASPYGLTAQIGNVGFATANLSVQPMPSGSTYYVYLAANYSEVYACGLQDPSGSNGIVLGYNGVVSLPIGIPFLWENKPMMVWGTIYWKGMSDNIGMNSGTLSYQFNGDGIWIAESKSQTMDGFLSFSYEEC
jgi:hypothetical protein